MKTCTFGRRNFLNLVLAGFALGCVALGSAQTPSTTSPDRANEAKAVANAPRGTSSSAKGRNGEESSDKGLNTAIKVHGHWVVEVRDPDGKVTARREFENSLAGGVGGGAGLLAGLLGRVVTSGAWVVNLSDSSGSIAAFISEPNAPAPLACTNPGAVCSNNLSLSATTSTGLLLGTLTLSGSAVWPQNSPSGDTINAVATSNSVCTPSTSTASCPSSSAYTTVVYGTFTNRFLDGQNGDPPAVPVGPGQTVTASVTFSFQ